MDQVRAMIGQCLLIGVILSFLLIFFGGAVYLSQHYNDVVNYKNFSNNQAAFLSLSDFSNLSSGTIILIGLYTLLFVQIFRVALTIWYFYKEKSITFVAISLGIFIILIATMLSGFFIS